MKRAIKTHASDFTAIIVLLVLSIVIAGYILHNERLRFPLIQSTPFTLNAEFSTAQAVTPGQGQTVRVSGVQIGNLGQVQLKNGVAIVQLALDQKYKHLIHTNATALLRPKTGLKDMFVELNPGTTTAPVAKEGFTILASNTTPDVNPDEILHALDADTREYLSLLVNGAGQGLKGRGGSELAQVFQRFEPTHRDLARLNKAVAARGAALRSLIHSLQVLNTALATKQNQIVSLIDASSTVFRAFAAENQNVSQAVHDLPGTLTQATQTLNKVQRFAALLAPATRNLVPAVEQIPNANAASIALANPNGSSCGSGSSCSIVRDQVRPFVRAATPVVRSLRPAAVNLANATPNLAKSFTVLNHLFDMLGYYPKDGQHGYLWWLAWLDHNARTLFSVQDANGDFRPLFLQASCATYSQIVNNFPAGTESVLNLTPILTSANLCPAQAAADKSAYKAYQQRQAKSAANSANSRTAVGPSTPSANNLFYPKLPTN